MSRRPARLGMGVLAVLAVAAVVLTARAAVDGQPAAPLRPGALPVRPVGADTRFDPAAATADGVPRGTTIVGIQIANRAVTTLARRVPLGAPVEIVR